MLRIFHLANKLKTAEHWDRHKHYNYTQYLFSVEKVKKVVFLLHIFIYFLFHLRNRILCMCFNYVKMHAHNLY
jgi:uncharacterized membrane protein YagU involved in acid resistance